MSESHNGHRKAWLTAAAISTTVLLLLMRQRRQKRKAARQSAADATRAALEKAVHRSLLPVFVHAESLPTGWGVAPPVFYPPHSAVIPLVLPSEMEEIERSSHLVRKVSVTKTGEDGSSEGPSAFILCTHTNLIAPVLASEGNDNAGSARASASVEAQQKLLADLLAHHPILKEQFAGLATQWAALPALSEQKKATTATPSAADEAADAVPPVFTHVLQGDDNCVLLGGVNGPYFIVAVLSGFTGSLAEAEAELAGRTPKSADAQKSAAAGGVAASSEAVMDLAGVVRGVARAALTVPLSSSSTTGSPFSAARLPGGAAFAVHRGHYRVLCVREGRELDLCIPAEVSVRSELVNHSLLTPLGSPTVARVSSKAPVEDSASTAASEALLSLTFTPSPFSAEDGASVRISEDVFTALVDSPQDAAATLWRVSGAAAEANPTAAAAFRGVTSRPLVASSHGRANMVTIVYVQPQLGVLFSVHPLSSVVYEPWMTELPTILYYPLGEEAGADDVAPPQMSIEYLLELPATWEVLKKDEEELRHNVLFHFTNWESATVSSAMTEISGLRCVMFHEDRDGRRCRSYILPRGATVLMVRWETSVETWEKYLPVFQQTLDTLHIDATAITK